MVDNKDLRANSRSLELRNLREKYIPKAVYNVTSICIEAGDGSLLKDIEGREYIDFASGIGCINTGHRNARITSAIKMQVDRNLHLCFHVTPYESYIKLAEKLSNLAPGSFEKMALLVNSGAEAIENSIKISRYSGKPIVICFENAFHGRTNLCMSLTGSVHPYKYGFVTSDAYVHRTPYAYCYRCSFGLDYPSCNMRCVEYIQDTLDVHLSAEETSAILVEPIQGEGGFIVPPKEFIQGLRRICDDSDILLIADEVQSGIGRTGKMFAIEHFSVSPDIIALAKALGGGLPLGAVVGRRDLMNAVHVGGLGGTFGGNPLSCVAGLETLQVINERVMTRARRIGDSLLERLKEMAETYDIVGDVRGLGLMAGVELVKNRRTKEPAREARSMILSECHRNGLLVIGAGIHKNVIRFMPSLFIDEVLLNKGLEIFEKSIRKLTKGLTQ